MNTLANNMEISMLKQKMQQSTYNATLHSKASEYLFCFKRKLSAVFKDVIGLHDIDTLSLYLLNDSNELIALSHTPSIEFNLFDSGLWQYDNSFNFNHGQQSQWAWWQNLYHESYIDDLHFIKQIKPRLKHGITLLAEQQERPIIYSFASKLSPIEPIWQPVIHELQQIGDYCYRQLLPLIEPMLCSTVSFKETP